MMVLDECNRVSPFCAALTLERVTGLECSLPILMFSAIADIP